MAKLTLLTLALAAALVAIATAHTTIVTTTIEDENPISSQRQCSQRLQGQRLNQCHMFLEQGQMGQQQQDILQQCCQELQNVDEECQCEAVKKVFREVQQEQQQQQGSRFRSQQTQQLKQKAQILPNVCNLQSRQCQIGNIITTVTESNLDIFDWPFGTGSGSQQCKQTEIERPVNQCQRFVEQQMRSPKQGQRRQQQQQQQPGLQECCMELQNVKRDCQCEAIKEVAKRVMQQQQQGGWKQQGQQQQVEIARKIVQDLPNQCYLEVKQCNIPYGMM